MEYLTTDLLCVSVCMKQQALVCGCVVEWGRPAGDPGLPGPEGRRAGAHPWPTCAAPGAW